MPARIGKRSSNGATSAKPTFEVGDLGFDLAGALSRRGHPFRLGGSVEGVAPVVGALGAEESGGEEWEQRVVEALLVQVHVGRVADRDVLRSLMGGLAGVVRRVASVVAPHAQTADAPTKEAAVEVVALGGGSGDGGGHALARALVGFRACLHRFVLLTSDDGGVCWFLGPDPGLRRVGAVVALLAGSSVPDLVVGELGVPGHLPDAGPAPRAPSGRRVDRHWWRVTVGVGVESVADLEEPDTAAEVPVVDGTHHRRPYGVQLQCPLVDPAARLVGLGWSWVTKRYP